MTLSRRYHLLEIHEQPWCSAAIRDGAMDCLKIVATVGAQYQNVVPLLQKALNATGNSSIVDLCSGAGGPWPTLYRQLQGGDGKPVQVTLTDLYPDVAAFEQAQKLSAGKLSGAHYPVDVTTVSGKLKGLRTLFTAFHHFRPSTARAILQDAVDSRQGIAIFEQTQRSVGAILVMLLLPWIAFLVVPFIRPFCGRRLIFTFLIPAIPLVLCLDGIVSCLRTYSSSELQNLVESLDRNDFSWQIGSVRAPLSPIPISYLIGLPPTT